MIDVFSEANKKRRPLSLSERTKQQDSDNDEDFVPQISQWHKRYG